MKTPNQRVDTFADDASDEIDGLWAPSHALPTHRREPHDIRQEEVLQDEG